MFGNSIITICHTGYFQSYFKGSSNLLTHFQQQVLADCQRYDGYYSAC